MVFEQKMDLFNRNLLRLRQQKVDEATHDEDQSSKQNEDSVPEMAHRCKKTLRDQSCEEHIHADHDALPRRSRLQWKQLARNQPSQWPPRPSISQHEQANHAHQEHAHSLGQLLSLSEIVFQRDSDCDLWNFRVC